MGVVVHTEGPGGVRASYWAKKLVMTPGAWLDKLVPEMQVNLGDDGEVIPPLVGVMSCFHT